MKNKACIDNDVDNLNLIKDAYYNDGGFVDGSYLTRYPLEGLKKYEYRKKMASCPDMVRVVVDSNIMPIFGDVARTFEDEILKIFQYECSDSGLEYREFIEQFFLDAELFGFGICWYDLVDDVPQSMSDVINGRNYPRLINIPASSILWYQMDGFGVVKQLLYLAGITDNGEKIYGCYDLGYWYLTKDSDGRMDGSTEPKELLSKPFVYSSNRYCSSSYLPSSRYRSTAIAQRATYELSSMANMQGATTSFSVLTFNGNFNDGKTNIDAHSILEYPEGTNPPSFVAPADTMQRISDRINAIEESAYKSHNLGILYSASTASGASKKQSDLIRQQVLKSKSMSMSEFEKKILDEFLTLMKRSLENAYALKYPVDFESLTITQDIDDALKLQSLNIAPENMALVRSEILLQKFVGYSDEAKLRITENEVTNDQYPNDDGVE